MLSEKSAIIIIIYLVLLVGLGIIGKFSEKEKSLSDFYLAGRQLSFFVIWFTLFASQYSGNALIGFAAKGYRSGFFYMSIVTGMICVIGGYLFFAPKLYNLSRKYKFITPVDFIRFRFNDYKPLVLLINIVFIFTLANYITTNLKAMGIVIETFSDGVYTAKQGIIFLAFIMIIYETLGGMRSVAWTDVLQGVILLVGCIVIFLVIVDAFDLTNRAIFSELEKVRPSWYEKPDGNDTFKWISTLVLFTLSIPLYPHAIQRIYSAKSKSTLKKSFQFMAFMPFLTMFLIVTLGILSNVIYPSLSKGESETVMILMLKTLISYNPLYEWVVTLFIAAVVAAIMSTVDSALLSLASIFSKDMMQDVFKMKSEKKLLIMGKVFSWGLMIILVFIALRLDKTIWALIQFKLEILIQLAPAFILGLNIGNLSKKAVFYGLIAGLVLAIVLKVESIDLFSLHVGLWGLILNLIVIFITQKFFESDTNVPEMRMKNGDNQELK